VSPLFSPGENRLAYLRPAGRRVCEGEECAGEVQVVTVDLASMEREILLPAGRWGLLAWSDTRLFVSDERDLSRVVSVRLDGDRVALDVAPSEFWGVSPDGSPLLQSRPGRVRFLEIADAGSGELEGGEAIQLGGVLAEGLWRRAPTEVLGVLLERRATRSTLVRLRPGWRAPQAVEGSAGAVGGVLDAPDGRGFAFVRVAPSDPNRLQATYCSRAGDCRPLFEWVRGVDLLGLDGG
ncbi:MAG: hypothetical protein M3124_00920, partial [Actinomycetota bacterium]|nr:hypothetical protein [Actinomycetota bacterium]